MSHLPDYTSDPYAAVAFASADQSIINLHGTTVGGAAETALADGERTYVLDCPRCDRPFVLIRSASTHPTVCRQCAQILASLGQHERSAVWVSALAEAFGPPFDVAIIGTGGGCSAICVDGAGYHVLVTGEDAAVPTADDSYVVVGLYETETGDHPTDGDPLDWVTSVSPDPTTVVAAVGELFGLVGA